MEQIMNTLREVTAEKTEKERILRFRYPWFDVAYNWLIVALVISFGISCIIWAVNIHTDKKAASVASTALAQYQEEERAKAEAQAAELAAAQKSEEAVLDRWANAGAKMLYGIRNFKDKYNYSETDYETYLQCVWNRYLYGNSLTDVEMIISQKDQFLGYYDTSPVLDDLYRISKEFFTAKLHETSLACDPSYRFAELTPKGIYLVSEFGADGYARRYHA